MDEVDSWNVDLTRFGVGNFVIDETGKGVFDFMYRFDDYYRKVGIRFYSKEQSEMYKDTVSGRRDAELKALLKAMGVLEFVT